MKLRPPKNVGSTSQNNLFSIISEIGCPPSEPDSDISYEDVEAGVYVDRLIASYSMRECFDRSLSLIRSSFEASKDELHSAMTSQQVSELKEAVAEWRKIREMVIDSTRTSSIEYLMEAVEILRHAVENQLEECEQSE